MLTLTNWIFLATAAGFAGFVDSVAGGGGLVQLPALLVGLSGRPLPLILGTNKVPAIMGTSSAAINYWRRAKPDPKLATWMALPAFGASMLGAQLASHFPTQLFRPFLLLLLSAVAVYTWRKKALGLHENLKYTPRKRHAIVAAAGGVIGLYDGMIGPGTGTFLLFVLVTIVGYEFLRASATAKLVNIATNLAAIVIFGFNSHIWWRLGLILGLANITGALLGSRLALRGGSKLVRQVFLIITFFLIARVGYDWVAHLHK